MNERQIEILLDADQRQYVLLGEIRDLLAARLPAPVEESEVERLRQECKRRSRLLMEAARAAGVWSFDDTISPEIETNFPVQIGAEVERLRKENADLRDARDAGLNRLFAKLADTEKENADLLRWHRESVQRLRDVCQSIITRIGSSGQETAEDALARLFAKLADTEKELADTEKENSDLRAALDAAKEATDGS